MTCERCENHPDDADRLEELLDASSFGPLRRDRETLPPEVLEELLERLREVCRRDVT